MPIQYDKYVNKFKTIPVEGWGNKPTLRQMNKKNRNKKKYKCNTPVTHNKNRQKVRKKKKKCKKKYIEDDTSSRKLTGKEGGNLKLFNDLSPSDAIILCRLRFPTVKAGAVIKQTSRQHSRL